MCGVTTGKDISDILALFHDLPKQPHSMNILVDSWNKTRRWCQLSAWNRGGWKRLVLCTIDCAHC